jgi:hypothetical protein
VKAAVCLPAAVCWNKESENTYICIPKYTPRSKGIPYIRLNTKALGLYPLSVHVNEILVPQVRFVIKSLVQRLAPTWACISVRFGPRFVILHRLIYHIRRLAQGDSSVGMALVQERQIQCRQDNKNDYDDKQGQVRNQASEISWLLSRCVQMRS